MNINVLHGWWGGVKIPSQCFADNLISVLYRIMSDPRPPIQALGRIFLCLPETTNSFIIHSKLIKS